MHPPDHGAPMPARIGRLQVASLAWPVALSMLTGTLTGLVDTFFVGPLGTSALAAIGLSEVTFWVVTAYGFGLLGGVRVATSQAVGAELTDDVRRLAWQGLGLALALGFLAVASLPLLVAALPWSGAEPEVVSLTDAHLRARLLGAPLVLAQLALGAWFLGQGRPRLPTVATIVTNVVNLVLDPVLIFGWGPVPALGLPGAAWATNVGLLAGLGVLLAAWARRASTADARPHRGLLERVFTLGNPMGVLAFTDLLSFSVIMAILSHCGAAHMAAHALVIRIIRVSFLPGHAVGEATGVLVGQAVGAGRRDLAEQAANAGAQVAVTLMLVCGVVFAVAPRALLLPFSPEPEVLALGRTLLLIAACFQVLDALCMAGYGALSGAGDSRFLLRLGLAMSWLVKVPAAAWLALTLDWGVVGVWLAMTAEMGVFAAVAWWRVRGGRWWPAVPLTTPVPGK